MHENTNLDPNQDEILAIIRVVSRVELKFQQWLMAKFGISFSQYDILVTVLTLGSPTPTEVAAVVRCTRGNVSSIMDRLEAGGFLRRQRDLEDRRVVRLAVKNKAAVKEMRRAFNRYVAELRQTWSVGECRSVQTTCEKLNSVL